MSYRLLASASFVAVGLATIGLGFSTPAAFAKSATACAVNCDCTPIRLPAKFRKPVAHHAVRKVSTAPYAETYYDYRSASAVDTAPYTQHWAVAPQGYVPPMPVAIMTPAAYGQDIDMPPPPPMAPPAYSGGYQDGYAYGYRNGQVDQDGWSGGVGYSRGGGGGGGGGVVTLAQPDGLNGPSYNSFDQSYGGNYGAANQIDAWRTQALTPRTSSSGN